MLSKVFGPVRGDARDVRSLAQLTFAITTSDALAEWYRRRVYLARYMRLDVLSEAYSQMSVRELRQYLHFLGECIRAESGPSDPSKVEDY